MSLKDKIVIVYCGGTIGGVTDGKKESIDSDAGRKQFSRMIKQKLPQWINDIPWTIKSVVKKLSENMAPND